MKLWLVTSAGFLEFVVRAASAEQAIAVAFAGPADDGCLTANELGVDDPGELMAGELPVDGEPAILAGGST